ncbi:MAG TPA: tetratricopeptide repeat protein [Deltaproteobacteria bacterium]|nr:tetratricopeptide repeat protein [Deltaproteobacteria bacterium]
MENTFGGLPGDSRKAITVGKRVLAIFTIISLLFLLGSSYLVVKGYETKKWPSVDGTIVSSKLVRYGKKSRAKIVYEYQVNGQKFKSDRITVESLINITTRTAKSLARRYRAGEVVRVYYNPKDHKDSVLKLGVGNEVKVFCLMSFFFCIFGLLGLKRFGGQVDEVYTIPQQEVEIELGDKQVLQVEEETKQKKPIRKSRALNFATLIIFILVNVFVFWPMVKPLFFNKGRYEKTPTEKRAISKKTSPKQRERSSNKKAGSKTVWKEAKALKSRGFKLLKARKYDEAAKAFQKCLALLDSIGGEELPAYPAVLNYIGYSYYKGGKLKESEKTYKKAISISEKKGRSETLSVAASCDGLARVYAKQGKYSEAETLFKRAMKIWGLIKGGENGNSVAIMYRCAAVLDKQGKHEEAKAMREKAKRDLEIIKARRKKRR